VIYPIDTHRLPLSAEIHSWPEIPSTFREFTVGITRDPGSTIDYSNGYEWHEKILPTTDSPSLDYYRLPNCAYRVNSDGMHWHDYVSHPDVLALGCSVTAGVGLPYEFTWPYLYHCVTGETVNSVARPGASISTMVMSAFQHIKHYGAPKKIFILWLDVMRYQAIQRHVAGSDSLAPQRNVLFYDEHGHFYSDGHKPYIEKDISGRDGTVFATFAVEENLRSLETLGYLCDILDIELTICVGSNSHESQLKNIGLPLVSLSPFIPERSNNRQHQLFWTKAWDTVGGDHKAHPGMYDHVQYAATFLQEYLHPEKYVKVESWAQGKFDYDAKHPELEQ